MAKTGGCQRTEIDTRELAGCTCMILRRVTRRVTQVYDSMLRQAALTANQFNVLAQLHWASRGRNGGLSLSVLAKYMGMDPTTLNRVLKPLQAQALACSAADPADRRVRVVRITAKGRDRLLKAIPMWRRAQTSVHDALGVDTTMALKDVLKTSGDKLAKHGIPAVTSGNVPEA